MIAFRVLLAILFTVVLGYTAVVVAGHGSNLMPVFFGDIAAVDWPGQFNVDFMNFLVLSAVWLAWRHDFTPLGLALAVLGFFGGSLFLAAYLFVAAIRAKGDAKVLLLGRRRADELNPRGA